MSSVSGSSTVNGLYSNPNQISGLVSGLDTESMIEGLVDSYNMKIISFQQDIVMQQWKQEAYRDVTNDLLAFSAKYSSLTNPSQNLASNTFWGSGVTSNATGANSSAISVSGTSSSTVTVDSVLQVATAERVVSSALANSNDLTTIEGDKVDLGTDVEKSLLTGSLGLTYGSTKITLSFTEDDVIDTSNGESAGEALANLMNEKLKDASVSGTPASEKFTVVYDAENDKIVFEDLTNAGNETYISSASGQVSSLLSFSTSSSKYDPEAAFIDMSGVTAGDLKHEVPPESLLYGETMTIDYNGNTTKITLPSEEDLADMTTEEATTAILTSIKTQVEEAYGSAIDVDITDGALNFKMNAAGSSTLEIKSSVNELLGLNADSATSYISGSSTLGSVVDMDFPDVGPDMTGKNEISDKELTALTGNEAYMQAVGNITYNSTSGKYTDSEGDTIVKITSDTEDEIWVKLDDENNIRVGEEISINGEVVGVFDANSTVDDVINAVNSSDAGVSVTFSKLTNNFVFTANETGESSQVFIDDTKLGAAMFGASSIDDDGNITGTGHDRTEGQNAIVLATVNGEEVLLERATNNIDIEGLKVTVKSAFNNTGEDGKAIDFNSLSEEELKSIRDDLVIEDVIGFEKETDFDPIVDLVKEMVSDYNELMSTIKTYFTEVPLSNSSGTSYKPLTDEDSSSMTESAVASYEEKAKTGLLFGDSNMRDLYNSLSTAFSAGGAFGIDLSNMGFSAGFGTTNSGEALDFDEEKFREMLETDIDTVRNAFTSTVANGGADGLMATLGNTIDKYASVIGQDKGILVNAAGSEHSSLSLLSNQMQDKIDSFQEMIKKWESKLSSQVDYYTSQFTKLEILMSEMNSQSSALRGLSSGY